MQPVKRKKVQAAWMFQLGRGQGHFYVLICRKLPVGAEGNRQCARGHRGPLPQCSSPGKTSCSF